MASTQFMEIKLYCAEPSQVIYAKEIAEKYQLQLVDKPSPDEWYLYLSETGLSIIAPRNLHFSPFKIDFQEKTLLKRAKELGKANGLVKALGAKSGEQLYIMDATAGLARDAFLLASLGHQVLMVERSPILAALIEDAYIRVNDNGLSMILERMKLLWDDSQHALTVIEPSPDVIYLDPMFPKQGKSALVKKDMQILQRIIGHGQSEDNLLQLALLKAKKRVVVKRPRLGPPLEDIEPDLQFTGKTQRFDVYLIR